MLPSGSRKEQEHEHEQVISRHTVLVAAFAVTCWQPALAADKKAPGAGGVKTQQGQTLSVPLQCSRDSGTCSCTGNADCDDLKALKVCDGGMSCSGSSSAAWTCSCKYKAPAG